jgi:hypothetical protein
MYRSRYAPILYAATVVVVALALGVLFLGCADNDNGARKDLPNENQTIDVSDAVIISMPDGFPNVAHKCLDSTGFWTTTDRITIIVYNDWQCPGSTLEQDMVVINGNPRSIISAS